MNVFEAVKQTVTTRQAAEMYGIRVNRHGMAVCPFHNDRNPSMKVDKRFHCFACQADGDAVDFVSRLFGVPSREAAIKLADDFGIPYEALKLFMLGAISRVFKPGCKFEVMLCLVGGQGAGKSTFLSLIHI